MSFFQVTDTSGFTQLSVRVERAIAQMPTLVQEALGSLGEEVVKALAEATPLGTGRTGGHLAESYRSVVEASAVSIRTTEYQKLYWVRYGTGIYGPVGSRIVPTTRPAMWWPEAAHPYTSVRGQHANDFVSPILSDIQTYLDEVLTPFTDQLLMLLEGG